MPSSPVRPTSRPHEHQKVIDGGGWHPGVVVLDEGTTDSLAGHTAHYYPAGVSCCILDFSLP